MESTQIDLQELEQRFQQIGLEVSDIYFDGSGHVRLISPLAATDWVLYLIFDGVYWQVQCGGPFNEIRRDILLNSVHRISFPVRENEVGLYCNHWNENGLSTEGIIYLWPNNEAFWKQLKRHVIRSI